MQTKNQKTYVIYTSNPSEILRKNVLHQCNVLTKVQDINFTNIDTIEENGSICSGRICNSIRSFHKDLYCVLSKNSSIDDGCHGVIEPFEERHDRGLAGPAGSDERRRLSGRDLERKPVEDTCRLAGGIGELDIAELDLAPYRVGIVCQAGGPVDVPGFAVDGRYPGKEFEDSGGRGLSFCGRGDPIGGLSHAGGAEGHSPEDHVEGFVIEGTVVEHLAANEEGESVDAELDELYSSGRNSPEDSGLLAIGDDLVVEEKSNITCHERFEAERLNLADALDVLSELSRDHAEPFLGIAVAALHEHPVDRLSDGKERHDGQKRQGKLPGAPERGDKTYQKRGGGLNGGPR
mmetsp:Transcript_24355/g.55575  ORF Transcript_24355/g.55575 Transcript_24355/m.55575 type:complete len:348 (+) Transcript_24355:697-1740(+)